MKLWLHYVETVLTIFFLVLALPGLLTATIQSGSDPRVVLIAILLFILALFARLLVAFREHFDQSREKGIELSSGKPIGKERTLVPTWATLAVILGVSVSVLFRQTKAS